jgi:PAS domain S-box-containing protein
MKTEVRRILIVDDSPEDCVHAKRLLTNAMAWEWQFTEVSRGAQGLALAVSDRSFDCILVDYHLPDMDGTEFLDLLRDRLGEPGAAVVMLTGTGNESIAVRAMKSGAQEYISKGNLKSDLLFRAVESAIANFQRNLTQAKTDQALVESEKRYRALADAMPQIVWMAGPDGRMEYLNQQWYEFTGSLLNAPEAQSWAAMLHPDEVQHVQDSWDAAVSTGSPYEKELRLLDRKSGAYRWHLVRGLPQRDVQGTTLKWVGTATDVDDHKRLNEELERRVDLRTKELSRSLAEKTTLLQEVHHRVKNNLQVICSLLSMQIACAQNDLFSAPLNDARSRVLAMSMIHEQIYQAENLAELNFGEYVKTLSDQLFAAYCIDPTRISIVVNVESIHLDVDQALPCGLILNELLSNALKHAFADGREGTIAISLKKDARGGIELQVSDSGIGLPDGFRLEDSPSLGLQVVRALIGQLRASLAVSEEGGTTFTLSWKTLDGTKVLATTNGAQNQPVGRNGVCL